MKIRSYSELRKLDSIEERYAYLRLRGTVGYPTFGFERYLNQRFYTSLQWKRVRDEVISRDNGNDLGVPGFQIYDRILIHHMNPMLPEDLASDFDYILNPEYLIATTLKTHNAIHYGDKSLLQILPPERKPGDTKLW